LPVDGLVRDLRQVVFRRLNIEVMAIDGFAVFELRKSQLVYGIRLFCSQIKGYGNKAIRITMGVSRSLYVVA